MERRNAYRARATRKWPLQRHDLQRYRDRDQFSAENYTDEPAHQTVDSEEYTQQSGEKRSEVLSHLLHIHRPTLRRGPGPNA